MDTYIKRQALITHVKDLPTWWADDGGAYGHAMRYPEGMFNCEDIISSIENAPAEDVKPVIHARWVKLKSYGRYECSVCHGGDTDCDDYYGTHWVKDQDYCPYCGAKMDLEGAE